MKIFSFKNNAKFSSLGAGLVLLVLALAGCSHTYPEDQLVEDLRALCLNEYGISDIDVKIVGKTIGVHLPLQKLFATDFSRLLEGGKDIQHVENIESLLQFSPEAMEKVENVLFSTSRVILSTEKDFDFYILTATDTAVTGIQLILAGYVDDLKRVRFWDISRDEYRKRIAHDLRVNRGVIWKKTVEKFFTDMGIMSTDDLIHTYFVSSRSVEDISPLFYSELLELAFKKNVQNEILEIKSTGLKDEEVVVYAKVRSTFQPILEYVKYDFLIPSGYEAEYMFVLVREGSQYKMAKVIPFHFLDESEEMERVEFPEELGLYRNIDTWLEDFTVEEISLADFLAAQLTRRVQQLLSEDQNVLSGFDQARIEFAHVKDGEEEDQIWDEPAAVRDVTKDRQMASHFRLMAVLTPKISASMQDRGSLFERDEVRYLLDKAVREFVTIVKSYRFEDYEYLDIISPDEHEILVLGKEQLERYRQRKIPLIDLFNASYPV